MQLGGRVWLAVAALLAQAAARPDRDFEFDDDNLQDIRNDAALPRHRFVYDPHSPLCRGVACGAGERCVLRDARTALCVTHDTVNAADDSLNDDSNDLDAADRCVRCSGSASDGGAVCGADGRTYASLCALDYRNCRRRARVAPRCATACPCAEEGTKPHRRVHHEEGGRARCAGTALADRLLAWFSTLQGIEPAPPARGFPRGCLPETRWMFTRLDRDANGLLSPYDLYSLDGLLSWSAEHDDHERCLRPFLRRCGARLPAAGEPEPVPGAPGGLTRRAWCNCMRRAKRPCAALLRTHKGAAASGSGWVPSCDAEGWFATRQCDATRCWCAMRDGRSMPALACRSDAEWLAIIQSKSKDPEYIPPVDGKVLVNNPGFDMLGGKTVGVDSVGVDNVGVDNEGVDEDAEDDAADDDEGSGRAP